ncbi:MAG: hypothetical protein MK135_04540 [Polyangiaceae bacterium]|nr:hypothetical protein [Polyangiaceae bacterium]
MKRKRFLLGFILLLLTIGCSSEPMAPQNGQLANLGNDNSDAGVPGGPGLENGGAQGADAPQLAACNATCVDLGSDPAHCGACNQACAPGTQCRSGVCEGCPSGTSDCLGACINTASDPNNCGACGVTCSLGSECIAGSCSECPGGNESCDGACVNLSLDRNHCGSCGNSCGSSEVCSQGTCYENSCPVDSQLPCGAAGECVDIVHNAEHCGACGQECSGDMACIPVEGGGLSRCGCYSGEPCNGQCTETQHDNMNCGGCGIACQEGQFCGNGVCSCGGDQIYCGGKCQSPSQCPGSTSMSRPIHQEESPTDWQSRWEASALGDGSIDCSIDPTNPNEPDQGNSSPGLPSQPGAGDAGGGSGTTTPTAGPHCGGGDWHDGKATWYELATPLVHCGYPTVSLPMYYGAINDAQYANADVCGACVEVEANGKTLELQIVDECPIIGNEKWCYNGSNHIDLNPTAFQYFHPSVVGVFDMRWRYVPCAPATDLELTFKEGSSIYWAGILIRHHPVPLVSIEVTSQDGSVHSLERQEYNYWLAEEGIGRGPYNIRITDSAGTVIERSEIPSLSATPEAANLSSSLGAPSPTCQ